MIKTPITLEDFSTISTAILNADVTDMEPIVIGNFEDDTSEDVSTLPKNLHLYNIVDRDCVGLDLKIISSTFIEETCSTYNVECMVAAYYPSGSFLGWHDNSNARMYNAICTFSDTGDSRLEYIDEHSTLQSISDGIGWTVKKSYWGDEQPLPHRVLSNCNRITLTFSSENESDVDNLIAAITA